MYVETGSHVAVVHILSSIFRSDGEETVEETKRARDEPPETERGLENAEPLEVLFTII